MTERWTVVGVLAGMLAAGCGGNDGSMGPDAGCPIVKSDDLATPMKCIEVQAYTIWDSCCKDHCEDCRKGCCDKSHREPSCHQGYPCCCEHDDDEDRKED